ncbi:LysR family transcriptional regulator [Stappia sp.]|uniref:LysR family transcriptional regulator n=1 Tax=Stappia sp. TaxID=1870903 RepID=UPI003A9A3D19
MDWTHMPPLSGLRAFAAMAEEGTFAGAGRKLNVSHAAVSQQVRALEVWFGCQLVRREGRGMALTGEGLRLAGHLDTAFSTMRRAVDELADADRMRPLQVTMTPAFAVSWLMPRLSEFRHRHPGIELMLNPTGEVVDLQPGGVDLAIRYGGGEWPGLASEPLLRASIVVVAARALVGDEAFPEPVRLVDFPWIQEYGTAEVSAWLDSQGVLSRKNLNIVHMPGYMVLEGLRRGDGISVTSRAFIEPEIRSGALRVLFEDAYPGNGYHMVTRPGVRRAPLKAFMSWLKTHRVAETDDTGAA